MTIWGNLTFYIGRVSRQACIEKLAQELGAKLEQEERNSEYIPILSFQCTTNGAYVEHSLSLSTVIWAISQVEGKQNGKLSDLLSSRAYSDTIEQLEREFFESDNFNKSSYHIPLLDSQYENICQIRYLQVQKQGFAYAYSL